DVANVIAPVLGVLVGLADRHRNPKRPRCTVNRARRVLLPCGDNDRLTNIEFIEIVLPLTLTWRKFRHRYNVIRHAVSFWSIMHLSGLHAYRLSYHMSSRRNKFVRWLSLKIMATLSAISMLSQSSSLSTISHFSISSATCVSRALRGACGVAPMCCAVACVLPCCAAVSIAAASVCVAPSPSFAKTCTASVGATRPLATIFCTSTGADWSSRLCRTLWMPLPDRSAIWSSVHP